VVVTRVIEVQESNSKPNAVMLAVFATIPVVLPSKLTGRL